MLLRKFLIRFLCAPILALAPLSVLAQSITNPIAVGSLLEFARLLLNVVIILLAPIVAFMLVYAGFLFVVGRGNESQLETAKKAFTYAVIGAALVLGAVALVDLLSGTLASFRA